MVSPKIPPTVPPGVPPVVPRTVPPQVPSSSSWKEPKLSAERKCLQYRNLSRSVHE